MASLGRSRGPLGPMKEKEKGGGGLLVAAGSEGGKRGV